MMPRVRIAVEVTLIGPILTHGSGAGQLGIDATVATLPDRRCYLPFSLIKGRLRQSWDELGFPNTDDWFGSRRGGWGATRGRLRFSDFVEVPSESHARNLWSVAWRHRIRIDEQTGAADDGALQVIESPFAAGEEVVFAGEASFFGTVGDAEEIRKQLELACLWTPAFGAGRTIGFGRVAAVKLTATSVIEVETTKEIAGVDFDYRIVLRDPFCLARRRIAENLFETDEVIPGSAIRGVAATTLNEILGRRTSEVIDAKSTADPAWAALARHFNAISIGHAFPSNGDRPIEPPISIVRSRREQFHDVALSDGPGLIGDAAPQFFIDWKGSVERDLRSSAPYRWPDLNAQKEIRVRTAIDRDTRRAAEKHLFSYEMIRSENVVWRGNVSFSGVPDSERAAVIEQFQRLFSLEPSAWGKSKARGRLTLASPTLPPDAERLGQTPWAVTLQTPALLCDPATLDESSGREALFDAYASAWHDLSDGSLRLVRFFAHQKLAGGYLVHRFRPKERYAPFLLTNPGSVFVLEPASDDGRAFVEKIARDRLPLPQWAKNSYGEHWAGNPFLPIDGFGEVVVNLACHREPIPGFELIAPWDQASNPRSSMAPVGIRPAVDAVPATTFDEELTTGTLQPVPFVTRWRITAQLRTTSDLHIGSGESLEDRITRTDSGGKTAKVEVAAVAVDAAGQPYLPGSGLKGALRSWLLDQFPHEKDSVHRVFGVGGDSNTSRGGKVEVHDARIPPQHQHAIPNVPYWNEERLTGVTASAAIDRRTRTAQDAKLFHREYVPAGISFAVSLTGDRLSDAEVALLVRALQGFNEADPIQLGAETREGWGRFTCSEIEVGRTGVREWLDGQWTDQTPAIVSAASALQRPPRADRLRLPLTISFTGPFLVNEPSRTKQPGSTDTELPNHAERVGTDGRVVLPVSSFRGSLRSRAEKIVRTLEGHACAATDPDNACKAIDSAKKANDLCIVCQLFGAPGWATPIDYEPFRLTNDPKSYPQELVAIDRFTGGVSGTAKFNVQAVWRPSFATSMTVDLSRWTETLGEGLRDTALGLLLLTLRDLADGDITLGFGASKGYGACEATIDWPGDHARLIAALGSVGRDLDDPKQDEPAGTRQAVPSRGPAAAPRQWPIPSASSEFHNPYHFVPVSASLGPHSPVGHPPAHVRHDRYVRGTFNGRLQCRIVTLTPLVIGAEQRGPEKTSKHVAPFLDPDTDKPAIPASSLRGLISSIAEAASNSALRVLNDESYHVWVDGQKPPVDGSAHDFFAKVSPELLPFNDKRELVTLAEEVFGYVDASGAKTAQALAGRVRFSMARLERVPNDAEPLLQPVRLRILSSPKPPSPAMYFKPLIGDGYVSKRDLSKQLHRPRGRKFYLHHPRAWSEDTWSTAHEDQNPEQKVFVTPITRGAELSFDIDFENLSALEMGMLSYAVRPTPAFMHKLGMGKSLGLGSVRIDPVAIYWTDRQRRYRSVASPLFQSCDVLDSQPESDQSHEASGIDLAGLHASFRATIQKPIRDALETLGDPAAVRHPVQLPQLPDRDLERETFRWFVKNESKSVKHQSLSAVTTSIPALSRQFQPTANRPAGDARTARRPEPHAVPPPPPPREETPKGPATTWRDAPLSYDDDRKRIIATAQGARRAFADATDPKFNDVLLAIKEQGQVQRDVVVRPIDGRRYELIEILEVSPA